MKLAHTRPYRQTARAQAAEDTRRRIMEAGVKLWRSREWEEVTLAEIAEQAGVTPQTILRRFGSKDTLVDACLEEGASGVESLRDQAPVGEPEGILDVLLQHYEIDGDAIARTLAMETRSDAARRIAEHGRSHHRAWCARVFAPFLPSKRSKLHAVRLDAFVAATDFYLWKLLRYDLGRTPAETRGVFLALLEGLVSTSTPRNRR